MIKLLSRTLFNRESTRYGKEYKKYLFTKNILFFVLTLMITNFILKLQALFSNETIVKLIIVLGLLSLIGSGLYLTNEIYFDIFKYYTFYNIYFWIGYFSLELFQK